MIKLVWMVLYLTVYYSMPCIIPTDMSVTEWLVTGTWETPLVIHDWDCSNTSAYTEWALENCGVTARLMGGFEHMFVEVELAGEPIWYEATTRTFVPPAVVYPAMYEPWIVFEDIYEALEWCEETYEEDAHWCKAEFVFNPSERIVYDEPERTVKRRLPTGRTFPGLGR